MRILNLGCGTKTNSSPNVINIDWSIQLRIKKNPIFKIAVPILLRGERLKKFRTLSENIMVYNLSKGLPFKSNSIDAVYHSHMLEHLDRHIAEKFLLDIKRVLVPHGIIRIVVPDFEQAAKNYISHISTSEKDSSEANKHDFYISTLLEQSVRKEAHGTSQQKPLRRFIENLLLGDARQRGETHQWMYDRINLKSLLLNLGYNNCQIKSYSTSSIPNWKQYGLDFNASGGEYKQGSLYLEAQKP